MISVVILTIGSVGLLGVFGLAVKASQTSQQDMMARQLASEAMESIYTARNSSRLLDADPERFQRRASSPTGWRR